MISQGLVRVNGRTAPPSYRLKPSDVLEIAPPGDTPQSVVAHPLALDILYEDDHLLVIDKPAGVATHPGPGHGSGTLVNALLAYLPGLSGIGDPERPGIVHRLDKDTSGLIIVAKTPAAHRDLSAQFKGRAVAKRYLALVEGAVSPPEGVIEAPVGRHLKRRKEMAVVEGGREAVTRYETDRTFAVHTLLRVAPQTGRTHQIRVHLAAIGHPVVGDGVYGRRDPRLGRHFLHATYLKFRHPSSRDEIEVSSPLPMELSGFLESLGHRGC